MKQVGGQHFTAIAPGTNDIWYRN